MAKIVLITYELNVTTDETCVQKAIQVVGDKWWHFFPAVWLVKTEKSTYEIANSIYPFMTKSDRLFVIETHGAGNGWMPQESWDWINNVRTEPSVSEMLEGF